MREMERQPRLWDHFGTGSGMMVHSHAGIQNKPVAEILSEIHVSRIFIHSLVRKDIDAAVQHLFIP